MAEREEEITDELILGFVRFVRDYEIPDIEDEEQVARMIDQYMRSRVAGG